MRRSRGTAAAGAGTRRSERGLRRQRYKTALRPVGRDLTPEEAAATALLSGLTLATHNTKDFAWIDEVEL